VGICTVLITDPDLLGTEIHLHGGTPTVVNKITLNSPHLITLFLAYICENETFVPVAL